MNLVLRLDSLAEERADDLAFQKGSQKFTYSQLWRAVQNQAAVWHAQGLHPGDRVLFLVPLGVPFFVALLSLWHRGAVAVVLDPGLPASHLDKILKQIQPERTLVAGAGWLLWYSRAVLRQGRRLTLLHSKSSESDLQVPPPVECTPESLALLTTTSGTSGDPKIIPRSHGFLKTQSQMVAEHLNLVPGQTDFSTLPIFALANLDHGVATILPRFSLKKLDRFSWSTIKNEIESCHRLTGAPAFLERLASELTRNSAWPTTKHLHTVTTGGAPIFPRAVEPWVKLGMRVQLVYGSSEAEPIAGWELDSHAALQSWREEIAKGQGLQAGLPVPGLHVRIVRLPAGELSSLSQLQWDEAQCAPGQVGEIVVSANHVVPGYWPDNAARGKKFMAEKRIWHCTGDGGYLDHNQQLWLTGPWSRHLNMAQGPLPLEAIVMLHPEVRRCVALPTDQNTWFLFLELMNQGTPAPSFLWPRNYEVQGVFVLPEIPVDPRHRSKVVEAPIRKKFAAQFARASRTPLEG